MDEGLPLREGLREFVQNFLPAQFRTADTCDAYGRDVRLLVEFLDAQQVTIWQAVGLPELQGFLLDQQQRQLTPSSRRRRVFAIKALFRYLVAYGYVSKQVNPTVMLIPPPVAPRQRQFLLKAEYEALLASADSPRDRAIIEVFLQTGLMLREMAGLTLTDVQLPQTVTPTPDDIGYMQVQRKRQPVQVPLNWKGCQALHSWLRTRQRLVKRQGWLTQALWVSRLGSGLSPKAIRNVVKKAMSEAGITNGSVYSLRHTYATHFLVNGGTVKLAQKLLGHQRLETTNVYLELAERAKWAVVQRAVL